MTARWLRFGRVPGPRTRQLLWLLLSFLGNHASPVKAQAASADEYAIRAAMLLNFTRFIDWPAAKLNAAHPQFVVCILGDDPIGPYLDRFLENQNVNGKPIRMEHLHTMEAASACHMLYLGRDERKDLTNVAPQLIKDSVLIISERTNASSPVQVIGLPAVDEHVQIEVDLDLARRSGITISSRLLRLAAVTR